MRKKTPCMTWQVLTMLQVLKTLQVLTTLQELTMLQVHTTLQVCFFVVAIIVRKYLR